MLALKRKKVIVLCLPHINPSRCFIKSILPFIIIFLFSMECERPQTKFSSRFGWGVVATYGISQQTSNFIGTYVRHNFRKFPVASDLLCKIFITGKKELFSYPHGHHSDSRNALDTVC